MISEHGSLIVDQAETTTPTDAYEPRCVVCDDSGYLIDDDGNRVACDCGHEYLGIPAEIPPLTDEEAQRIIRRLARYDDELNALEANYKRLKADLQRKREFVIAAESVRLQEWALPQLRGRARSVRILQGVVGWQTKPARLVVRDEAAAVAHFLTEKPEAVVQKLDRAQLPKPKELETVGEHGERTYRAVPGLDVEPACDTFYVKSGVKKSSSGASESDQDLE